MENKNSLELAKEMKDDLVQIRRNLHQHAELAFKEEYTSEFIGKELEALGFDVKTHVAETGVIGIIKGGSPGKTLAFRAEMDALPIHEETGLPFSSVNPGVMHACGHDATMAIVLGIAKLLSKIKNRIKGQVKFIFSPSEEALPGGAKVMLEEGVLENPKVDFMISCHCQHTLPSGSIGVRVGKVLASVDVFKLTIQTKGGFCGTPHLGRDGIAVAAQVINNLQYIVSRMVNPLESAVISIGTIHGGYKENTLADRVEMEGTVRALDPVLQENLPRIIERTIDSVTKIWEASYQFEYRRGYPPLITDKKMMELLIECAIRLIGKEKIVEVNPLMAGDDLAYFFQKVPGCWFILGTSNREKGIENLIHTSKFDIDEDALAIATGIMVEMARELMIR